MRYQSEFTTLLRAPAQLPRRLKYVTEEFREGWSFLHSGDALWLEENLRNDGWQFISIPQLLVGSGVADTAEDAIANALKLGLRRANQSCNSAAVEQIEVKQYSWFFLAHVRLNLYQIQPRSTH